MLLYARAKPSMRGAACSHGVQKAGPLAVHGWTTGVVDLPGLLQVAAARRSGIAPSLWLTQFCTGYRLLGSISSLRDAECLHWIAVTSGYMQQQQQLHSPRRHCSMPLQSAAGLAAAS